MRQQRAEKRRGGVRYFSACGRGAHNTCTYITFFPLLAAAAGSSLTEKSVAQIGSSSDCLRQTGAFPVSTKRGAPGICSGFLIAVLVLDVGHGREVGRHHEVRAEAHQHFDAEGEALAGVLGVEFPHPVRLVVVCVEVVNARASLGVAAAGRPGLARRAADGGRVGPRRGVESG